jgi:DNA-binding NarL/FixJ family response regulator
MIVNRRMPPITVLLAEDADAIRSAIKRILQAEPGVALVGEAVNFSQTLQMTAELKPQVVLLDLHMPGEQEFSPAFVKSQLLLSAKHVLVISIWNDNEARALATSYGAATLLDKINLGSQLVPAILRLA